ncbi:MAG: hypothetical protein ACKVU4_15450 [Phycisphaerales bacterium]
MPASAIAEWYVAVLVIVTGLSHVLAPRHWGTLFKDLLPLPYAGLLVGLPSLMVGLWVVLSHNAWTPGIPLIVTLLGWGWTIKGTLYLLVPGLLRRIAGPHVDRPGHFVFGGVVLIVLGAVVLASRLTAVGA